MATGPALIFDLDGTLVDTAPDLLGAINFILEREGRKAVDMADLRHLVGHGARVMLAEAFVRTGAPLQPERMSGLMDEYIAHYRANIANRSRPFPGVEATLRRLSASSRLGVLTNKPQELTDLLLPAVGLARFFGAIHGAGRMAVSKPDAAVFHHVVEELGGPGKGALMIGDSATDVATARAADVPVILVDYGYTPTPAAELGADAVTSDFADVPALVGRLLKL